MDQSNIVLCGPPGSGKTTIGKLLAAQLGMEHIDTDALIELQEGKSCRELYMNKGEGYFRRIETEIISQLRFVSHSVISLGGGAVIQNETLISELGRVIYLKCPLDVCKERKEYNPALGAILSREAAYERIHHYAVDTAHQTIEETLQKVAAYGSK